jgi:sugar/nucleoside kinase (ribokinase family)
LKTFDAVVIGDANIDLAVVGANEVPQPGQEVFVENVIMHVGGGAAVFSLALAKLGLHVAFNGILGDDIYGRYVREHFSRYGIDTRLIQTSKNHNTGVSIAFNPDTDRSFITYAGTNMELQMDQLNLEEIAQGRHVHVTGYKGRSNHEQFVAMARSLKEKGVTLSCDVGWDDSGEWYKGVFELMRYFDVFLMNETEALHYTGLENIEDSLRYMSQYCSQVAVKLGAKGAAAMKDGVLTRRAAYPVEAVDTTGAGDCFNAGYLFGFLSGMDVETSLQYGNACGALSVNAYGGSTGSPDAQRMQAFIREREEHPIR